MLAKLNRYGIVPVVSVLYAIELLDELIYGLQGAVMPLVKSDLALSYTQIGLLSTVPGLVGLLIDPLVGVLGDTRWRGWLVRGGVIATVGGLALAGFGQTYAMMMTAYVVMYVASGAYVNMAQATLMDLNPARTEQTMARWTLLGSIGVAIAPLLATAAFGLGYGWQGLYLALAGMAGVYIPLVWRIRFRADKEDDVEPMRPAEMLRALLAAFRNRDLVRWVLLTELADLMLDKLYDQTGLYFFDVVGVDIAQAAFAAAVFTLVGLAGNLLLVPLLERVSGLRILRLSALVVLVCYAGFLLVPSVGAKYVLLGVVSLSTAGWFAILRGRTYQALPGQSGMVVAVTSLGNLSILLVPTIIGGAADWVGLQAAMWLLMLGPLALLAGLPKERPTLK